MDQSLMEKLAISKKIMDAHDRIPNGSINGVPSMDHINESNYNIPNPNYNIPDIKSDPMEQSINKESVMGSNLPDEIKKLMIENPIQKPSQQTGSLSNDIIEGAAKLINQGKSRPSTNKSQTVNNDLKETIRNIVRDTVRDTVVEVIREELNDKVILSEDGKNVKDKLTFKVGNHLFEGYVTKIKKIK